MSQTEWYDDHNQLFIKAVLVEFFHNSSVIRRIEQKQFTKNGDLTRD